MISCNLIFYLLLFSQLILFTFLDHLLFYVLPAYKNQTQTQAPDNIEDLDLLLDNQLCSFSAAIIKNIGLRVSSFISGSFNMSSEGTDSFTALIIKPDEIKSFI